MYLIGERFKKFDFSYFYNELYASTIVLSFVNLAVNLRVHMIWNISRCSVYVLSYLCNVYQLR